MLCLSVCSYILFITASYHMYSLNTCTFVTCLLNVIDCGSGLEVRRTVCITALPRSYMLPLSLIGYAVHCTARHTSTPLYNDALDSRISISYERGYWLIYVQKLNFRDQSVQKIEWKQTDTDKRCQLLWACLPAIAVGIRQPRAQFKLQNILRYLTIMQELRLTCLGMVDLQNSKIVLDSIYKLAYDFPTRNLHHICLLYTSDAADE